MENLETYEVIMEQKMIICGSDLKESMAMAEAIAESQREHPVMVAEPRPKTSSKLPLLAAFAMSNCMVLHPKGSAPTNRTRAPLRFNRRPVKKCLLPDCDAMTDHNGGYCCAEHCREHQKMRKLGITAEDVWETRTTEETVL